MGYPEKTLILIYNAVKERIHEHADLEKDLPICIGELSELILELTRYQRGKMDHDDFLQELSHVQWAVWMMSILLYWMPTAARRHTPGSGEKGSFTF